MVLKAGGPCVVFVNDKQSGQARPVLQGAGPRLVHAGPTCKNCYEKSTRKSNKRKVEMATGSLREYMGHMPYIWLRKIGRTRASGARECANAAPAAMPLPTEANEGCSGLVGDACVRQLDGGVDGRRPPYRRRWRKCLS